MRNLAPYFFEVHVTNKAPSRKSVDPHIDNDRPSLYHLRQNKLGSTRSNHQNISQYRKLREVSSFCVANANRCVTLHQHKRDRLANNVACAYHYNVFSFNGDTFVLQ